jgi:hypothetical protein
METWKQSRDIELKERNKGAKILVGETITSAKIMINDKFDDMSDLIINTKSGKKIKICGFFNDSYTGNSEGEYQCLISVSEYDKK